MHVETYAMLASAWFQHLQHEYDELLQVLPPIPPCGATPWDSGTCVRAARAGNLAALQLLRMHNCPWDTRTCTFAARYGHLQVLVWAREHGCEWNGLTCLMAARGGHLEVLRWAREHNCPSVQ